MEMSGSSSRGSAALVPAASSAPGSALLHSQEVSSVASSQMQLSFAQLVAMTTASQVMVCTSTVVTLPSSAEGGRSGKRQRQPVSSGAAARTTAALHAEEQP